MLSNTAYIRNIWLSRYFWFHLALSDIRAKYRRSVLGLAWALIQPLVLTCLLTFVMSNFFHAQMYHYAPFIFSGLIFWEFISSTAVQGCNTFVAASGYIKQFTHPLLIYSLRGVIPAFVNLLFAFGGLVIWILFWKPENIGISWLSLVIAFPMIFFVAWPLNTITGFIGAKFRDFSYFISILLSAIYYISPILFLPKLFYAAHIGFLIEYNPVFHILNLFRKPLLEGKFPLPEDYLYVMITSILFWIIAWTMIIRQEKKIIYYL